MTGCHLCVRGGISAFSTSQSGTLRLLSLSSTIACLDSFIIHALKRRGDALMKIWVLFGGFFHLGGRNVISQQLDFDYTVLIWGFHKKSRIVLMKK